MKIKVVKTLLLAVLMLCCSVGTVEAKKEKVQVNTSCGVEAEITYRKRKFIPDTLNKVIYDNALCHVYYTVTYIPDTLNRQKQREGKGVLSIGSKYSSYMDFNERKLMLLRDSIGYLRELSDQDWDWCRAQIKSYVQDDRTYIKNYPQKGDNIIRYPEGFMIYEDNHISFDWELGNLQKTIEGYLCQNAICSFRGRTYEVWYTSEIAISDGPWLFTGLPGLILEAYDTNHEYVYTFAGIEQISGYSPIYHKKTSYDRIVTREEYRILEKNDYEGLLDYMKLWEVEELDIVQEDGSSETITEWFSEKRPYNPIEKE